MSLVSFLLKTKCWIIDHAFKKIGSKDLEAFKTYKNPSEVRGDSYI